MSSAASFQQTLKALYDHTVDLYRGGNREVDTYFSDAQHKQMKALGAKPMDFYDYAEDFVKYGEPDWETFLLVQSARRDYFLEVQGGQWSDQEIDPDSLPPKKDEVEGIVWLPRIYPKALAKLRGELDPSIMYGCGGDRGFCRTHDIHLADLLRACWAYENDFAALVRWVQGRSKA